MIGGDQRNVFIEQNPKQENVMRKLESALEVVNHRWIKDTRGCEYNYRTGLI